MTDQERFLAVVQGEAPDRLPYIEAGIDFPFVCRLPDMDLAADGYFDPGEYQTMPIDLPLALNEILHRSNLTCHLPPPIPAHKPPGQEQILFFHDGYLKTWDDLDQLTFPDLESKEVRAPVQRWVTPISEASRILPQLVELGITSLSPIEPACMEMDEVGEALPELVLLTNVDVDLLTRGTVDAVRASSRDLIAQRGPSGRFALSSGNSAASYCSLENARAMCDAVTEFGGHPSPS